MTHCKVTANLSFWCIDHGLALVLSGDGATSELLLADNGLLLVLDELAERAAARLGDVGDAVALEVILAAQLGGQHG